MNLIDYEKGVPIAEYFRHLTGFRSRNEWSYFSCFQYVFVTD